MGDELIINDAAEQVKRGGDIIVADVTAGKEIICEMPLSDRQRKFILAGGVLNSLKKS